jgi:hypothetical protein
VPLSVVHVLDFFCFVYIHIAKYQLLLSRPGQKIMVK